MWRAGWISLRIKIDPRKSNWAKDGDNPPETALYPLLCFLGKTLQGDVMRERPQRIAGRVKDVIVKIEPVGSLWRETKTRFQVLADG